MQLHHPSLCACSLSSSACRPCLHSSPLQSTPARQALQQRAPLTRCLTLVLCTHTPALLAPVLLQGTVKAGLERLREVYRTKARQLGADLLALQEQLDSRRELAAERSDDIAALEGQMGDGVEAAAAAAALCCVSLFHHVGLLSLGSPIMRCCA